MDPLVGLQLIDIPDDKIYEICEKLDTRTLAAWMQTNTKIKDICQGVLDKRKLSFDLVNQLVGNYVKIKYTKTGRGVDMHRIKLNIIKTRDSVFFSSEEPIIEGMQGQFKQYHEGFHIYISRNDIPKLQELKSNLAKFGYIKLGLPWGHFEFERILIEDFPNKYGVNWSQYLDYMSGPDLIRALQQLDVEVTEEMSDEQLRNLLLQELRNRGRFTERVQ